MPTIENQSVFCVQLHLYATGRETAKYCCINEKVVSIFNYALSHPLPEGQAIFLDIFTYLKAALSEPRAGYWVY